MLNCFVIFHHSFFSDSHCGFRFSRWTGYVLTIIAESDSRALGKNAEVRAVALDIGKVFDMVWHLCFVHKLESYSISGQVLSWSSRCYQNLKWSSSWAVTRLHYVVLTRVSPSAASLLVCWFVICWITILTWGKGFILN